MRSRARDEDIKVWFSQQMLPFDGQKPAEGVTLHPCWHSQFPVFMHSWWRENWKLVILIWNCVHLVDVDERNMPCTWPEEDKHRLWAQSLTAWARNLMVLGQDDANVGKKTEKKLIGGVSESVERRCWSVREDGERGDYRNRTTKRRGD